MPVYNGEQYLAEAIESILTQTLADFELIIVDDGSQDNSAEIIRAYMKRDGRIRFFQLAENVGAGEARNCGMEAAEGKYLTFMDCDDISLPQRLQMQATFLDSHPDIGAVGVEGQLVSADLSTVTHYFHLPQHHELILLDMFVGVGLIYATVMLKLADVRAIGGNEEGRRHGEDRELPWRLLYKLKIKFANLSENLYLYRWHDHSTSLNRDSSQRAEAAAVYERMLCQLWGEAPAETLDRFFRMAQGGKLGWLDRRAAKHDMTRLIDAFASHGLVELDELPLLADEAKRRLEGTMPRLWQKFLHWRRHRLRRLRSLTNAVS